MKKTTSLNPWSRFSGGRQNSEPVPLHVQCGRFHLERERNTLQLSYGDLRLTGQTGCFGEIHIDEHRFDTTDAEWTVDEMIPGSLLRLKIRWRPFHLEQIWELQSSGEALHVKIFLNGPDRGKLSGVQIFLSLHPLIRRWMFQERTGLFSMPDEAWQSMPLYGPAREPLLLSSTDSTFGVLLHAGAGLRYVLETAPEWQRPECSIRLEQTDLSTAARSPADPIIDLQLDIVPDADALAQKTHELSAINEWRCGSFIFSRKRNGDFSLSQHREGTAVGQPREISWCGTLGFYTTVAHNDKRFHSRELLLKEDQSGENLLSLKMEWAELKLTQIWRFSVEGEKIFWTVITENPENSRLSLITAGYSIAESFRTWYSADDSGHFYATNDLRLHSEVSGSKQTGILFDDQTNERHLYFRNEGPGKLYLHSPLATNGIDALLQIRTEPTDMTEGTAAGNTEINLSAGLLLGEQPAAALRTDLQQRALRNRQIQFGRLRLAVFRDCLDMFWTPEGEKDERKLTQERGIHSNIRIDGTWVDTTSEQWRTTVRDRNLIIEISWRYLHLRQRWIFFEGKSGEIIWRVELSGEDTGRIERIQLGFVLDDSYHHWLSPKTSGEFRPPLDIGKPEVIDLREAGAAVASSSGLPHLLYTNRERAGILLESTQAPNGQIHRVVHAEFTRPEQIPDEFPGAWAWTIPWIVTTEQKQIHDWQKHLCRTPKNEQEFGSGPLRLRINEQQVHIFYNGQKLTAENGFFCRINHATAFCNSDNTPKQWKNNSDGKTEGLIVTIQPDPAFPLTQYWEFTVTAYSIRMSVHYSHPLPEKNNAEARIGLRLHNRFRTYHSSLSAENAAADAPAGHDFITEAEDSFCMLTGDGCPDVILRIPDNALLCLRNTDAAGFSREAAGKFSLPPTDPDRLIEIGSMELFFSDNEAERENLIAKERLLRIRPEQGIVLLAAQEYLHKRISGKTEWTETLAALHTRCSAESPEPIGIGISRYNFFRLHEIVEMVLNALGIKINLSTLHIPLFPLRRLWRNFREYLNQLQELLHPYDFVYFFQYDPEFFHLFSTVSRQANEQSERKLLRLLGVVCEHAFIGPQVAVMDPYHRCNANCVHCWVHAPGIHHKAEFLERKFDFERFKKVADDMAALHTDKIIFQGDGEPLLYDQFLKMAEYARARSLAVSFFTNGIALTPPAINRIIDMEIEEIFCSLPAGSAQTYTEVVPANGPAAFATILKNLEFLNTEKKRRNRTRPRLIMTHVIHRLNAHELREMAELDLNLGADIVRFYLIRLDENNKGLRLDSSHIEQIKQQLVDIKALFARSPTKLLDTTEFQLEHLEAESGAWSKDAFWERGCLLGWSFCLIPALGDISFCCHLRTVGYLEHNSFRQIWTSDRYNEFRIKAKNLRYNKEALFLNGVPLYDQHCNHCDTHQVIRDVWQWLDHYELNQFVEFQTKNNGINHPGI